MQAKNIGNAIMQGQRKILGIKTIKVDYSDHAQPISVVVDGFCNHANTETIQEVMYFGDLQDVKICEDCKAYMDSYGSWQNETEELGRQN